MEVMSFKEFMEQIGEVDLRKVTIGALVSGNSCYHLAEMIYESSFVRYRITQNNQLGYKTRKYTLVT